MMLKEVNNREMFKDWIRDHTAELFVLAIGIGISIVLAGGDVSSALAGSRRK